MSFYAFNPLAGGWLTSRYKRETQNDALEAGSRFDANRKSIPRINLYPTRIEGDLELTSMFHRYARQDVPRALLERRVLQCDREPAV